MSLLQYIIIIAAVLFILFGIDLYKRKKMNILHFIVFLGGGAAIIVFALDQRILNAFGSSFGLNRGADLVVYIGIILLFYFYFELLNQHTKDKQQLTRLISQQAINECRHQNKEKISSYKNLNSNDDFIFNIRVYNEGSKIGETIEEIIAAGFSKIILINDGSKDNSEEIIAKIQEKHPEKLILLASHTINRGGGAANQTGYNFVKKYGSSLKIKWFVGFDADGQMNVSDMKHFISAIHHDKKEVYLGSRFIEGGKAFDMPTTRKIILRISRIVTRILYRSNVSDPHNGYRVISLDALQKFEFTADGMHYANEFNEQLHKHKIQYTEVPVHIRYTKYSLGKGQKNSNSIKLGLEMIYKKIFFR